MTRLSIAYKTAMGLSCVAVYGPFVVMALYTLMFVSCSHCKATAWKLLPCAPGLIFVELGRASLDVSRPDDGVWFALAAIVSLAIVLALSWLLQYGPRTRWVSLGVAVAAFSLVAFGTLSMIRS